MAALAATPTLSSRGASKLSVQYQASSFSSSASLRSTTLSLRNVSLSCSHKASTSGLVAPRAQASDAEALDRFRLNNLAPQPGSRRKNKRKGRGYGAGQGGSCGFGMRGQKSRSGPKVRAGFEGGQMPLYRRLPKLKGIAGGMGAGLPKYVNVNLNDISFLNLSEGSEVSLESLIEAGIMNPSGRDRKLPLKILGDGEMASPKLTVKAAAFSSSAREKLEAAGCTLVELPGRKKFLPASVVKRQERMEKFNAAKEAGNVAA